MTDPRLTVACASQYRSQKKLLRLANIEQMPRPGIVYYGVMKIKELTLKQILSVACPTCGAAPKEVCKLHSGTPRIEPHRDRKYSAAEALETKPAKR